MNSSNNKSFKLSGLVNNLEKEKVTDFEDVSIEGIAYDSRKVGAGFIFVCIKGENEDGHNYVGEALRRGAVAILHEREVHIERKLPKIEVANSRKALSYISSIFFGNPSREMRIAGVTGTNGKTTTCHLAESILSGAGYRCGVIGTISYRWGDRVLPASRTTPESLDTQEILRRMSDNGCRNVLLEVSSHALNQHRVSDVEFNTAIFTNISHDHLDYHKTFGDYFKAKKKLFENLLGQGTAIVNIDDARGEEICRASPGKVITFGIEKEADVTARDLELSPLGVTFTLNAFGKETGVELKLLGRENVYNAICACAFGISEGIELEVIRTALCRAERVRGRFQVVGWDGNFTVVVDYAHTPQALERVLESARKIYSGKIITVFGCGGDRDKDKRPLMGEVASLKSDFTFITTDNPRSEDPIAVAGDIEKGFRDEGKNNYKIVIDRKEAISEAISRAKEGDVVLIAGKGHETHQVFRDTVVPFDDVTVAKEILEKNRR